jgi:hypothetical protein
MSAAIALVGCGKEASNGTAESSTAAAAKTFKGDPESEYCRAERAHYALLNRLDKTDPGAVRALVTQKATPVLENAKRAAPAEIRDAVKVNADWQLNQIARIFAKYNYDVSQFEKATGREQEILSYQHPAVKDASETVDRYDFQVCGIAVESMQQPLDVEFDGDPGSAYCDAAREYHVAWGEIEMTGLDPARVRAFFTTQVPELRQRSVAAAPKEISASVDAVTKFDNERRIPTLEKYGFDFGRVLTEGNADERAAAYRLAPEIREHVLRVDTYGDQICSRG